MYKFLHILNICILYAYTYLCVYIFLKSINIYMYMIYTCSRTVMLFRKCAKVPKTIMIEVSINW